MVLSKKWPVAFGVMILVFCTLGLPFKKMNFFWDAYGTLLHAVEAGETGHFVEEIFVNDIRSDETILADNQRVLGSDRVPSLFSFVYRPFIYVYLYVQYKLFGYTPFPYFLGMILLHALITMLLFLLLAKIISLSAAALLALFFAYNHTWWPLLRWIGVELYFIEAFFLMLFVWCLYKTLVTNQFWWSVPAAFCLAHNLLLKEQSLAALPWIGMVFLAEHLLVQHRPIIDWRWLKRSVCFGMPLVVVVAGWVGWRWHILQLLREKMMTVQTMALFHAHTKQTLSQWLLQWLKDIPNLFVDLVGLNWFPPFHRPGKAFFLVLFILFFIWLLRVVKPKAWFLFFAGSYWLFAWPTYTLRGYHPRFVYFSMIFFVGLVALALKILRETNWRQYRFAFAGLVLITILNAGFLVKRMCVSEQETDLVAQSFKTLVAENPAIFERTMCFYGLPPELFDACVAQAMAWLAPGRQCRTIYYFKHEKTIEACNLDEAFLATDPLFITWDEVKQKMIIA